MIQYYIDKNGLEWIYYSVEDEYSYFINKQFNKEIRIHYLELNKLIKSEEIILQSKDYKS